MKGGKKRELRRENAKKRLESQLKHGMKREKINGKTTDNFIPLTPTDITRIKKEIEILNKPKGKKHITS